MIFSFYVLVLLSVFFAGALAAAGGAADGAAGGDDVVGCLPAGRRSGLAGGGVWAFSGGTGGGAAEFVAADMSLND